jgi:hypothetical protein
MTHLERATVVVATALTLAVGAGSLLLVTREGERANPRAGGAQRPYTALRAPGDISAPGVEERAGATGQSWRRDLIDLLAKSAREQSSRTVQNAATVMDEEGPAAPFDPELALRVAQQLAPDARPGALREIFSTWAGIAPEQAARAAAELPEGDGQGVAEVARVWAEQAPAEAAAWASTLATREARREALIPIVDSWAIQDPKQAAAALAGVPDEGYKQRLVDTVAAEWVRASPVEARGWVETLPSALRTGAATVLLDSLLQSDAQQAANWSLELGGSGQSALAQNTLTTWTARDPGAALAWVIKLPERRGRSALLLLATERIRLQNGPGTERWIALQTAPGSAP